MGSGTVPGSRLHILGAATGLCWKKQHATLPRDSRPFKQVLLHVKELHATLIAQNAPPSTLKGVSERQSLSSVLSSFTIRKAPPLMERLSCLCKMWYLIPDAFILSRCTSSTGITIQAQFWLEMKN